jgi:hypothetical protein
MTYYCASVRERLEARDVLCAYLLSKQNTPGRTRARGLWVLPSLLSELSIALHTSHAGLVRLHQLNDEVVPGIAISITGS